MNKYLLTTIFSLLAVVITCESHAGEPPTPAQTFTDEITGLTWTRCQYGTSLKASFTNEEIPQIREACEGSAYDVPWLAATNIARDAEIDGKKSWRLPTRDEWDNLINRKTVSKALKRKIFPFSSADPRLWAGDRDQFSLNPVRVTILDNYTTGNYYVKFEESDGNYTNRVVLVLDKTSSTLERTMPEQGIHAERFFTDTSTGLTWVPALISDTYTRMLQGDKYVRVKVDGACPPTDRCENGFYYPNFWEAVIIAHEITLNGMTGWRIPSRAELETILPKLDTPGYPSSSGFLSGCFTNEPGTMSGTVIKYSRNQRENSTRGFIEAKAASQGGICLVIGNDPSRDYYKLVERALAWKGEEDFPITDKQAATSAALEAQEAEHGRKYLLGQTEQQKARVEARNNAEKQRKDRLSAFRSNLKPGDRTREGLVLQTKGELVLVQHQEQICVVTNSHGGCNQYRPRETGNQVWIRRNEVNLP